MRREFLKGYLLTLLSSGEVRLSDPPAVTLKKLLSCVREDFMGAAKELAGQMGMQVVAGGGAFVKGLVDKAKAKIQEKGFSGFWRDLNDQYVRGAAAMGNAPPGKRK